MQNQYDLFDNPMIRNILKQMSPEEIEKYKKLGEDLYGNMDMMESISDIVVDGLKDKTLDIDKKSITQPTEVIPEQIRDSICYITEGLKSGLLPRDLDDDEKNILNQYFGEEWYKKFGYEKCDL